jgi:hypothetical protein
MPLLIASSILRRPMAILKSSFKIIFLMNWPSAIALMANMFVVANDTDVIPTEII